MTDGAPDTFTRDLFAWQDQVLADREMTPLALHVALVIGQYFNRQSGDAWPSQETIAAALSISPDYVRKMVRQLVERGHLAVVVRHGRGDSNRYRMALETHPNEWVSGAENPSKGMGIPEGNPAKRMGFKAENPANRAKETHPNGWPNHLIEPSEGERLFPSSDAKPKRRPPRTAKPATSDAQFDEFWLCVPKAVGRADARRAYDKAITSGEVTHHEIMVGITRYAAEREDQDPQYTKHPATWLNKGCWADAPVRPHTAQQQQRGRGRRLDPGEYLKQRLEEIGDE